ncbi:MAG: adenylyl-sulfate kinase [Planctomycetes bacterium]|nr:adenylyl-sulfate kinase [Planctomycetota bacterium]
MTSPERNLQRHDGTVSRRDRERLLGQRGAVVWFTGLSGSGKSTVARAVEQLLHGAGRLAYVLDGDNVRHGLCADLGFSAADRTENIRRIGHVAALLADAGLIVLTAFISPFRSDRAQARAVIGADFVEIHVDAPLDVCEQRDPKGLYRKARAGQLPEFTGIDSPYEPPERPDLRLPTGSQSLAESAAAVAALLRARGMLTPPAATGS